MVDTSTKSSAKSLESITQTLEKIEANVTNLIDGLQYITRGPHPVEDKTENQINKNTPNIIDIDGKAQIILNKTYLASELLAKLRFG